MTEAHPYLPNALANTREAMLAEVGASDIEDLFSSIPADIRAPQDLGLPKAAVAEADLRRRVREILAKNVDTSNHLSFLGGGCWAHYVPAVVDEIAGRGEFWSAFIGLGVSATAGANQALFEYQSLISNLVGLDVATLPTYDWAWAAGSALLMGARVTGRRRALVADTVGPSRRRQISARLPESVTADLIGHTETGALDLDELKTKVDGAAAFYVENPSYLGHLNEDLDAIRQITDDSGCLLVAGVDPMTLGVVRPPGDYGADVVVGDLQPLGHHPQYGGSAAGFMVTKLDPTLVAELPTIFLAAFPTAREGQFDYGSANYDETSYASRGESTDIVGTSNTFAGVIAAVYLSLMGPHGMAELGQGLRARITYLAERLGRVDGVTVRDLAGIPFKECVVDFSETGQSVESINSALYERGIFGGIPLAADFPELDNCALYSVTENHTAADIERLAVTIEEICK